MRNVTIHARLVINPQTLVVVHARNHTIEITFSPMEIIFVLAKMVILRIILQIVVFAIKHAILVRDLTLQTV